MSRKLKNDLHSSEMVKQLEKTLLEVVEALNMVLKHQKLKKASYQLLKALLSYLKLWVVPKVLLASQKLEKLKNGFKSS